LPDSCSINSTLYVIVADLGSGEPKEEEGIPRTLGEKVPT